MRIDIKLLTQTAKSPVRARPGDAGADLFADQRHELVPGAYAVIKTGISLAIPEGYYGRIAPRSGLAAKHGIDVLAGVIDAGYRSEVGIVLINHGRKDFVVNPGDRIAQLIIETCAPATWHVVDELPESVRGADGWGSTKGWKS